MKKIYSFIICAIFLQPAMAQDLSSKIPADADAVFTFNTKKLTSLVPAEEFDKTAIGKKLKEAMGKDSSFSYHSIKDFGTDLNSNIYYFHKQDDSLQYHIVLIPLADAAKADQLLAKKDILRLPGNVRKQTNDDSSGVFLWNDQQLISVNISLKESYFYQKEVAERYGLSTNSYYYYDPSAAADSIAMVAEAIASTDTIAMAVDSVVATIDTNALAEVEPYVDEEGTFDYYNDMSIKKRISATFAGNAAAEILNRPDNISGITGNASYRASVNNDAAATLWVNKPTELYYKAISNPFMLYDNVLMGRNMPANPFVGYESVTAHLSFNEKQANIHTEVTMSDEMIAMQKKLLDRNINKQFYKYINTDSMLGYMSWAMNTQHYLEQFPYFLQSTYGRMRYGMDNEEFELMAEFFSLIIDEEAISKMIKGDIMVLFDGLYQQETTYTDYTYNDNFEQSEIIKTKKETLPRFLLMLSSEENKLVKKLVNYGIAKKVVNAMQGFYEIEVPKSPVRFYFTYKNDVFFLTNSLKKIQEISSGTFKSNISKAEKKFIGDHHFSMFINPKLIASELSRTEIGAADGLTGMINSFNKMGAVRMKVNPIRGNTSSADLWMEVPGNNSNGLGLLLSLFENMIK